MRRSSMKLGPARLHRVLGGGNPGAQRPSFHLRGLGGPDSYQPVPAMIGALSGTPDMLPSSGASPKEKMAPLASAIQ